MSSNGDEKTEIERALRHPVAWVVGGIASIVSVIGATFGDPAGVVATVLMTFVDMAMPIFTASSIAGFTLAPEISQIPARELQYVALASGAVVVILIGGRVWDNLKERVQDE